MDQDKEQERDDPHYRWMIERIVESVLPVLRIDVKVKGLGTVRTIKFAAKLLEGEVFKGEEDMLIWISDDENRLPVYFEAPLRVGVAAGRMTGYSGLKHPFTSLVNNRKR